MTHPTPCSIRHFEALAPGETFALGTIRVTRDMIIGFATQFDPLPFHLDEEAARKSLLGGLAASGWQTGALSLRLLHEGPLATIAGLRIGAVNGLKWRKPVLVDDTITGKATIVALRPEHARPNGIAVFGLDIANQHGDSVMTLEIDIVVARKPAASGDAS
ncbi:Acyl dehydratase [Devosia enhydra]|uniref:Acyl dehydratase n=1 Tax=Devosia enhydra TaxID=665118 RepID=A0A1K2HW18_9HYPH|nr:MaoC/PaaZ C-terminal domain-containing protein [Devosia enhydra]SFZ83110.1 Acyl dehydratase [Devosia enhydra]